MCGGGLEPTVCLISALNHHWYNNNIAIGVEPMYAGRSLPNTMYRTPHTDYHVPDIYFGNIRLSMQSQGSPRNWYCCAILPLVCLMDRWDLIPTMLISMSDTPYGDYVHFLKGVERSCLYLRLLPPLSTRQRKESNLHLWQDNPAHYMFKSTSIVLRCQYPFMSARAMQG